MAKLIRWGLITLIGLIIIVIIAINMIDLNQFKPKITEAVKTATGRTLTISGDIGLSVFPKIGVSIGEVALSNPESFSEPTFAKIDALVVGVKLLPLLSKKVEVDEVVIAGAQVHLIQVSESENNWSDLSNGSTEEESPQSPAAESGAMPINELNIQGIRLENASFKFTDKIASKTTAVDKLSVVTGPVALNQPIDLNVAFDFVNTAPELSTQIKLTTKVDMDLETQKIDLLQSTLDVSAVSKALGINSLIANMLWDAQLDLTNQVYVAKRLKLNAEIDTESLPSTLSVSFAAEPQINLTDDSMTIKSLQLTANQLELSGEVSVQTLTSSPWAQFDVAANISEVSAFAAGLGAELPMPSNSDVLKKAELTLTGDASSERLVISKLKVLLDEFNLGGDASVNLASTPMAAKFALKGNAINVDDYLPVPSKDNGELTDEELGKPAPDANNTDLFAWMDLITLDGNLTLDQVTVTEMPLQDIKVGVKSNSKTITAKPVDARLWGGQQSATVIVTRGSPPKIDIKEKLNVSSVDTMLTQLLGKSFLDGIGDIELDASMTGLDVPSILQSLSAAGKVALRKGSIPRINLSQEVREAKARFKGESFKNTSPKRSEFDDFISQFSVQDGVLKMQEINMSSGEYKATGTWDYNIASDKINANLDFVIPESARAKVSDDLKDFIGVKLPIKIKGSVLSPSISVDVETAMKNIAKQAAKELEQKAKKKVDAEADRVKKKAEKKLKEELKDVDLKGLFR